MIAVVPCWNRPGDLPPLLDALREQALDQVELSVVIVDNASDPALEQAGEIPEGLDARFFRLPDNQGGSGGFNAGIKAAIANRADLVWLLDSDAVPEPGCLGALISALDSSTHASAAGSALADPDTGEPYEFGGDFDHRTGELVQHSAPSTNSPHKVGYNAACSLLVRSAAIRAVGLMPDLFISGDDAAWCRHLAQGFGPVLCAPDSIVRHPHPARMRTSVRYHQARNGLTNAVRFGLSPLARARRVFRELFRASAQRMVGRDDLAQLHLQGVRDAWKCPAGAGHPPSCESYTPWELQDSELRAHATTFFESDARAVSAPVAFVRWLISPRQPSAMTDARAHPRAWVPASRVVTICRQGSVERRVSRFGVLRGLAIDTARFALLAFRAAIDPPTAPAPERLPMTIDRPSLSIVLLTHGERAARALKTLSMLSPVRAAGSTEVVLVCNGGVGPLPDKLHDRIPVRVFRLGENLGVEGFNRGVDVSESDMVLILDDDAWPDERSLERAVGLVGSGKTDAVSFARRHPATRRWEWPGLRAPDRFDAWPDMGCCNLVRTSAWRSVGGYERSYFLYRNDTDLALSLLGAGFRVRFERDLFAWHDSPTVGRQHPSWFRLATRNWVWMARRHGRGLPAIVGVFAGWGWAHKQAGRRLSCQLMVLRGMFDGVFRAAPKLNGASCSTDGSAFGSLISLKLRGRVRTRPAASPAPAGSPARAD